MYNKELTHENIHDNLQPSSAFLGSFLRKIFFVCFYIAFHHNVYILALYVDVRLEGSKNSLKITHICVGLKFVQVNDSYKLHILSVLLF